MSRSRLRALASGHCLPGRGRTTWLRRLGLAGFLFFLVKGLLWLLLPTLLVGNRWLGD